MVRKLDIPMKDPDAEPTTCWTKLQAVLHTHQVAATLVAAVAALWTGARLAAFVWRRKPTTRIGGRRSGEYASSRHQRCVHVQGGYFSEMGGVGGPGAARGDAQQRRERVGVLRMVSSDNRRARIPILSDPSYEYSKPEMIQKWLDEKCQAWCAKHCPQSSLRHTPTRTGTDPKVYLYGEVGGRVSHAFLEHGPHAGAGENALRARRTLRSVHRLLENAETRLAGA